MSNCTSCGFEVSPASSFCAACGAPSSPEPRFSTDVNFVRICLTVAVLVIVTYPFFVPLRKINYPQSRIPNLYHPVVQGGPDPSNVFGIALYPDLKPSPTAPLNSRGLFRFAYYSTDASIQDVTAFYLRKYGHSVLESGDNHSATLALRLAERDTVMITVTNHSTPTETGTHLAYSRIMNSSDRSEGSSHRNR